MAGERPQRPFFTARASHISAASDVLGRISVNPASAPTRTMRLSIILVVLGAFAVITPLDPAFAQLADTGNFHIVWEVKNRFRLFRREADFLRQVAASRGDGDSRRRAAAGARQRRPGLGQGRRRQSVPRRLRQPAADLRARRRKRELSDAPRPSDRRRRLRPGAAGRNLRLDLSTTAMDLCGR